MKRGTNIVAVALDDPDSFDCYTLLSDAIEKGLISLGLKYDPKTINGWMKNIEPEEDEEKNKC